MRSTVFSVIGMSSGNAVEAEIQRHGSAGSSGSANVMEGHYACWMCGSEFGSPADFLWHIRSCRD